MPRRSPRRSSTSDPGPPAFRLAVSLLGQHRRQRQGEQSHRSQAHIGPHRTRHHGSAHGPEPHAGRLPAGRSRRSPRRGRRTGRRRGDRGHLATAGRRRRGYPHHDAPGLSPSPRGVPRTGWGVRSLAPGLAGDRHELHRSFHRTGAGRHGGCCGCRDARRPRERRRQGSHRRHALDHGRWIRHGLRSGREHARGDGQHDRPRGTRRRRPGGQGLQPGRRRGRHRGGRRSVGPGCQGWRRPRSDRRRATGRTRRDQGPGDASRPTCWVAPSTRDSVSAFTSRT